MGLRHLDSSLAWGRDLSGDVPWPLWQDAEKNRGQQGDEGSIAQRLGVANLRGPGIW